MTIHHGLLLERLRDNEIVGDPHMHSEGLSLLKSGTVRLLMIEPLLMGQDTLVLVA